MSSDKANKEKRTRRRAVGLRKHQHIENVVVEESFSLLSASDEKVGDGVYVAATTSGSKRFYGILVDQPALKEASSLWLQDQSDSLDLNRRIQVLKHKSEDQRVESKAQSEPVDASSSERKITEKQPNIECTSTSHANGVAGTENGSSQPSATPSVETTKRARDDDNGDAGIKRAKIEEGGTNTTGENATASITPKIDRPVQKFKYIAGTKVSARGEMQDIPGYRVLVATFSSIYEAANGDSSKMSAIEAACENGGNFLDGDLTYYYQYEVLPSTLSCTRGKNSDLDLRTSMGFHSFLRDTILPAWFPLSNITARQGRVLNMLNLKRDHHGNITWDSKADEVTSGDGNVSGLAGGTKLPMQERPKKRYQIGVVGGGIAGIACCKELLRLLDNAGIDVQIKLFEARSRLGGRLWTDRTFVNESEGALPIELGASWIHGIQDNPLAALAKEAGTDFATASEEVQMLGKALRRIDSKMDERSGQLFDDLLDDAADDCWAVEESTSGTDSLQAGDLQAVIRWYSSIFARKSEVESNMSKEIPRLAPPVHRRSSDRSIDTEMGKAIAKHKIRAFSKLSADEHRMLMWNTKNIEYALGANISDLSMKYWESDEVHAFEGDHVLLRQGYSHVIQYMMNSLHENGNSKFELFSDFPVGKIEYARKSTSQNFGIDRFGRTKKMVELSDTCSVASQDGSKTHYFDFVVCACPLGVLKESLGEKDNKNVTECLTFHPPLPFSKADAISNVGFGLLDKIYLKFPRAFWREEGLFQDNDQCLFGNVTGVHPHHYMFFDIGRCFPSVDGAPAILMSLVSGKEAVACENLSDKQVVEEVMETLKTIFSGRSIPEPIDFRFTRWGQDKYSRGSYTFLPPGATDQDYQLLQSPINGNGDSLVLDTSETMRLFFAGEHTTALHPSMAHGALLSGMRAAKEILATIELKGNDEKDIDRVIPVALFRHKNPEARLQCSLCHRIGGSVREGSLVAFKRGARQVLVHNNCAEYSPEVEVVDYKWKNVIKAVNRGKSLACTLCKKHGATIGCTADNCFRVFHFSCAEDAGWRFERDGKVFYCDLHRKLSPDYSPGCDRISIPYFRSKNPQSSEICQYCFSLDAEERLGELLAFQLQTQQICVHEKCVKYTNTFDTTAPEDSRMGHEYKNVFRVLQESRRCSNCSLTRASVTCTAKNCQKVFHIKCAMDSGWNFDKRERPFRCHEHQATSRKQKADNGNSTAKVTKETAIPPTNGQMATNTESFNLLQHNLLAQFGAVPTGAQKVNTPGNLDIGGTTAPVVDSLQSDEEVSEESSISDDSSVGDAGYALEKALDIPLSRDPAGARRVIELKRENTSEPWEIAFQVLQENDSAFLTILDKKKKKDSGIFGLRENDIVVSVDSIGVGIEPYLTLRDIISGCLKNKTELTMEVINRSSS